jgi:hypothetical protein
MRMGSSVAGKDEANLKGGGGLQMNPALMHARRVMPICWYRRIHADMHAGLHAEFLGITR